MTGVAGEGFVATMVGAVAVAGAESEGESPDVVDAVNSGGSATCAAAALARVRDSLSLPDGR